MTHGLAVQILRLFSESAGSIQGLKDNLGDARDLLGARHKQLHSQWCRSVTLRHVITLLDQIDKVAQVPARIEKLIAEKRYYAAVQLHLQSISMLDREGIQSVSTCMAS
jgi:exocyst complex component 4